MLKVLARPLAVPSAQVLQEDVCGAIKEDESAFNEFRGGTPTAMQLLGPNIPRPAQVSKCAGPSAEIE